jgi:hypothetical protein
MYTFHWNMILVLCADKNNTAQDNFRVMSITFCVVCLRFIDALSRTREAVGLAALHKLPGCTCSWTVLNQTLRC